MAFELGNGLRLENFTALKSPDFLEKTLVELWTLKAFLVRAQEREESYRESFNCLREYTHYYEQNVAGNNGR